MNRVASDKVKVYNTTTIPMLSRAQVDAIQLARARRMASRKRSETACIPCKTKKAKCSDYRPCARCQNSGREFCENRVALSRSKASSIQILEKSKEGCLKRALKIEKIEPALLNVGDEHFIQDKGYWRGTMTSQDIHIMRDTLPNIQTQHDFRKSEVTTLQLQQRDRSLPIRNTAVNSLLSDGDGLQLVGGCVRDSHGHSIVTNGDADRHAWVRIAAPEATLLATNPLSDGNAAHIEKSAPLSNAGILWSGFEEYETCTQGASLGPFQNPTSEPTDVDHGGGAYGVGSIVDAQVELGGGWEKEWAWEAAGPGIEDPFREEQQWKL